MNIAVASDHAGFLLKEAVKELLVRSGHSVVDFGTQQKDIKVDYPDFGLKAAVSVAEHRADKGILVCGTGLGMSIAANKVTGIRAALCHDHFTAVMSRRHNDANILVIGARVTGRDVALDIVKAWLSTDFDGGRHSTRIQKIADYEASGFIN